MPVIEVNNLHKRYGNHVAVADVSFTVERGEIFGILGPNGAGKTTTVECIEGVRKPDKGQVTVLGLDPQKNKQELRQRMGAQLQASELPDKLKVWEALQLYSSFYQRPNNWEKLIEDLGLADKRNTPFAKLSGGQKQRLSIALALVGNPEVAILDELTTGLDPQGRREIWRLIEEIRAQGVTILLVTHFMDEAEQLCDRLAIIDRGKIIAVDSPVGLVNKVQVGQRIRFRPSTPLEERLLTNLPEVSSVGRNYDEVMVTGTGDMLQAVTSVLARHQITPLELRMERPTLEDAFVALMSGKQEQQTQKALR